MRLVKVGAAAVNQTPLDWDGNRARILAAIAAARAEGVTVLALPELAVSGYGCEDAFFSPDVPRMAEAQLRAIAAATTGMCVAVGMPVFLEKALYNCVALLVDGKIAGYVAKQFLAGDGIHYEPRWFKAWPSGVRDVVATSGAPIGDVLFDVGGVRIGFEICEDAWVANRPGASLALRGADLILNPSASHFAFGKFAVRQRFVMDGSRAFGVGYLYANLLGNEAGRVIYDGGCLIASGGELLARGRRLAFTDLELTCAIVDIDANRREQARRASHRPAHVDANVVTLPFSWPHVELVAAPTLAPSWEDSPALKHEEFTRAVALGLFDYARKSHAHGFVLSLSGGADSAACAVLVRAALELACADRRGEELAAMFPRAPQLAAALARHDLAAAMPAFLRTAYQATANSGQITRHAAAAIAQAIGATHHELEVEGLVATYRQLVGAALGRELAWPQDDIALQNIQARVRAPSVWLLANLDGALLLTTSNRSEAAVGYATMDGDMAGGLAPLGGIDKRYLREYLRWREHHAPAGLTPVPALAEINRQAPTAELRPASAHQTDEHDLMPYDVLEAIEDAAIRDKHGPQDVLAVLHAQFPGHARADLIEWVRRFFRLWCKNQWKRERMAPSFHLDDRNVDPRSWCRFPILSGGYEAELAALR